MKTVFSFAILFLYLAAASGCSSETSLPAVAETSAAAVDGDQYLLETEPEGLAGVIAVRESASDGDDVVITGRIGGSANPWVNGRAAFSIVDHALTACSDIPGDACEKPWDYCCQTDKLPTSTALVKFVDDAGRPLAIDSRELLSVKELQTVVVRGKAQRDDAGNLTVLASQVFVRPETESDK
jgi:hypothetical protein